MEHRQGRLLGPRQGYKGWFWDIKLFVALTFAFWYLLRILVTPEKCDACTNKAKSEKQIHLRQAISSSCIIINTIRRTVSWGTRRYSYSLFKKQLKPCHCPFWMCPILACRQVHRQPLQEKDSKPEKWTLSFSFIETLRSCSRAICPDQLTQIPGNQCWPENKKIRNFSLTKKIDTFLANQEQE